MLLLDVGLQLLLASVAYIGAGHVSLHNLLLAVCLQLSCALVACIGARLWCEPAQVAARCVLAAVVGLCTQANKFVACVGAGLLCEPANLAARCVPAAVVYLCGLLWCRVLV